MRDEALKGVKGMSFLRKLYTISMSKPSVWRAMKARELQLNRCRVPQTIFDATNDAV